MKTKMICFIAFISYTFYLTAGDIYVSPYGNDKAAGTRQSPLQTLEQAIKQAPNGGDCNHPKQPEA